MKQHREWPYVLTVLIAPPLLVGLLNWLIGL